MADKESLTATKTTSAAGGSGGTSSLSSAQPNNPLSKKLNKILETRLENDKVWCISITCTKLVVVWRYTIDVIVNSLTTPSSSFFASVHGRS